MIGNHHDMVCYTFLDFLQIKSRGLVHPVELLHLQQLPVKLNLTEVVHTFPHKILIIRVDM